MPLSSTPPPPPPPPDGRLSAGQCPGSLPPGGAGGPPASLPPLPLLLLLAALTLFLAGPSHADAPPDPDSSSTLVFSFPSATPIAPTPFLGYPEAYALHNDHIHAVVIPAISRLAFLAPSPDAPNLLRLDPTAPSSAPGTFPVGGVSAWPAIRPHRLQPDAPPPPPPDAPSDASAWVDMNETQHVLLTSHYPAPIHATLTCEFRLPATSSSLRCRQTLTRDPDAPSDAPPLALWHVTRLADPDPLHFTSVSSDAAYLSGATLAIDAQALPPNDGGIIFHTVGCPALHANLRPIPALACVDLETVNANSCSGPLSISLYFTLPPALVGPAVPGEPPPPFSP